MTTFQIRTKTKIALFNIIDWTLREDGDVGGQTKIIVCNATWTFSHCTINLCDWSGLTTSTPSQCSDRAVSKIGLNFSWLTASPSLSDLLTSSETVFLLFIPPSFLTSFSSVHSLDTTTVDRVWLSRRGAASDVCAFKFSITSHLAAQIIKSMQADILCTTPAPEARL